MRILSVRQLWGIWAAMAGGSIINTVMGIGSYEALTGCIYWPFIMAVIGTLCAERRKDGKR